MWTSTRFFASVEQRDNPELIGKPVIVGAAPGHRGVVSTCSYEARAFGVHSAMPISEAVKRLPESDFFACAHVALLGDFARHHKNIGGLHPRHNSDFHRRGNARYDGH